MPNDELTRATIAAAAGELDAGLRKIAHCLDQLTAEQVWWRPQPGMNAIGNLLLHLAGNVRQWIVAGLGGEPDTRDRPGEFSEQGPIEPDRLLGDLRSKVEEAKSVLARAPADELLRPRSVQAFDVTGVAAVFHSVSHFQGHVQEIVHLTRLQLGPAYEFEFVPTPEQGGPSRAAEAETGEVE